MGMWIWEQNNNDGRWSQEIPLRLYIVAESQERADAIKSHVGVYEGFENGDCTDGECCGPRWSSIEPTTEQRNRLETACKSATLEQGTVWIDGGYVMRLEPVGLVSGYYNEYEEMKEFAMLLDGPEEE